MTARDMPDDPADLSAAEFGAHFAHWARLARAPGGSPGARSTLLHIGDEQAVLLSGSDELPDSVHRLELGAARIARDFFRHDPPSSREIEAAIDAVEDQLMRVPRSTGAPARLASIDEGLRAWAAIAGPTMSLDTVEQWFQRLASASLGRPGAMAGLPAGTEAAATLLVLRECMQHLGYASITLLDPDTGPQKAGTGSSGAAAGRGGRGR